jgi:hypothetical protein
VAWVRSGQKSALVWDAFVAGLVDHYAPPPDRVLWRVTKPGREMTCRVREIRTPGGCVGLELRVEHNGQVYRTEAHTERIAFHRRVEELREMPEAEGWTLTNR